MPEIRDLTASVRELDRQVGELGDNTRELRGGLNRVRSELHQQTINTRMAIGIVVLVIVVAGLLIASLAINSRRDADRLAEVVAENQEAIRRSEAKWCPLLDRLAPRAGAPTPAGSPEQREYALETRRLLADLAQQNGCR
jgi:hypothetical protein